RLRYWSRKAATARATSRGSPRTSARTTAMRRWAPSPRPISRPRGEIAQVPEDPLGRLGPRVHVAATPVLDHVGQQRRDLLRRLRSGERARVRAAPEGAQAEVCVDDAGIEAGDAHLGEVLGEIVAHR